MGSLRFTGRKCGRDRVWVGFPLLVLFSGGAPYAFADERLDRELQDTVQYAFDSADLPNITRVRQLLKQGANPNASDLGQQTAVHKAVIWRSESHEVLQVLLEGGGDCNAKDNRGRTPLHYAAEHVGDDFEKLVRLLLDCGSSPNHSDGDGNTPLLLAVSAAGPPNKNIVSLLLQAGANPDGKDRQGNAPLHLAVKQDHEDDNVVSALLASGANPCIRDAEGYIPMAFAKGRDYDRIATLLDRAGGYDLACDGAASCQDFNQLDASYDDLSEEQYYELCKEAATGEAANASGEHYCFTTLEDTAQKVVYSAIFSSPVADAGYTCVDGAHFSSEEDAVAAIKVNFENQVGGDSYREVYLTDWVPGTAQQNWSAASDNFGGGETAANTDDDEVSLDSGTNCPQDISHLESEVRNMAADLSDNHPFKPPGLIEKTLTQSIDDDIIAEAGGLDAAIDITRRQLVAIDENEEASRDALSMLPADERRDYVGNLEILRLINEEWLQALECRQ